MKNILVAALVGAIVALGVTKLATHKSVEPTAEPQMSAYDRVVSSHTLRCAYAAFDPMLVIGTDKNPTGIMHDVVEEAGKRLGLKVVWAEEVNYGSINAGFVTNRYDAFCAGLWPAGTRATDTLFSRAVVWDPIGVWVRGDDARFDGHLEMLNDPAYKVADIDGDATAAMVDALYPKSSRVFMTQNNDIAEEILNVTTRKADALFSDYISVDKFMKNNPEGLKDLSPGKPPLIFPVTIGFNQNEFALRDMFDVVLNDMDRDGTIGRIVKSTLSDKSNMLFFQQNQFTPYP